MNGGIPVVSLFGIEIRVSLSLAIMIGFVALIGVDQASVVAPGMAVALQWALGAIVAVLFLITVIIHELAHALVGRRRGVPTTTVVLGLVGGMAPLSIEASKPGDEMAIALAGPLASLLIAAIIMPLGIALGISGSPAGGLSGGVFVVGALNLMLGLASLLPGLPLDGGRVVRAIAWARTGDRDRAAIATARAGRILGWIVVGLGVIVILRADPVLGLMIAVMGWLLGSASRGIEQRAQVEQLVRGLTAGDALIEDVPHVGPSLTVDILGGQLGVDGAPTAVPVLDDGQVVGVLGATAVRRLGTRRAAVVRVADVMAKPPLAPLLTRAESLWTVMETMQRRGLDGLAVVEEGRLLGMVTRDSAAEAMRDRLPAALLWGRRR